MSAWVLPELKRSNRIPADTNLPSVIRRSSYEATKYCKLNPRTVKPTWKIFHQYNYECKLITSWENINKTHADKLYIELKRVVEQKFKTKKKRLYRWFCKTASLHSVTHNRMSRLEIIQPSINWMDCRRPRQSTWKKRKIKPLKPSV